MSVSPPPPSPPPAEDSWTSSSSPTRVWLVFFWVAALLFCLLALWNRRRDARERRRRAIARQQRINAVTQSWQHEPMAINSPSDIWPAACLGTNSPGDSSSSSGPVRMPFHLGLADIRASVNRDVVDVHEICLSTERTIFDKVRVENSELDKQREEQRQHQRQGSASSFGSSASSYTLPPSGPPRGKQSSDGGGPSQPWRFLPSMRRATPLQQAPTAAAVAASASASAAASSSSAIIDGGRVSGLGTLPLQLRMLDLPSIHDPSAGAAPPSPLLQRIGDAAVAIIAQWSGRSERAPEAAPAEAEMTATLAAGGARSGGGSSMSGGGEASSSSDAVATCDALAVAEEGASAGESGAAAGSGAAGSGASGEATTSREVVRSSSSSPSGHRSGDQPSSELPLLSA